MRLIIWPDAEHHVQVATDEFVPGRTPSVILVRGRVIRAFAGGIDPSAGVTVEFLVPVAEEQTHNYWDGYSQEILGTELTNAKYVEVLLAGRPPHCELAAECRVLTHPSDEPSITADHLVGRLTLSEWRAQTAEPNTIGKSWLKRLADWIVAK